MPFYRVLRSIPLSSKIWNEEPDLLLITLLPKYTNNNASYDFLKLFMRLKSNRHQGEKSFMNFLHFLSMLWFFNYICKKLYMVGMCNLNLVVSRI